MSNLIGLQQYVWAYSHGMDDDSEKTQIDPVRVGLGMRLASARKGKGMTQDQVADRFSVKKGTVSAWETGRGVPDAIRLRELAKLYDVSADSLLWEDSLSPAAMKFAAEFDSLSDKQRRTFLTVWMAFASESASNEEVEQRMPITKRLLKPSDYKKNAEDATGFSPADQEAQEKAKKEG